MNFRGLLGDHDGGIRGMQNDDKEPGCGLQAPRAVNTTRVEAPAESGRREAEGGGAVDADLVPGQVDCLLES